jgi:hypothetical protein
MFNMFKKSEEKVVVKDMLSEDGETGIIGRIVDDDTTPTPTPMPAPETVTSGFVQVLDDKGEPTETAPESVTTTSTEEKASDVEFPQPPPLGYREMKYLKRANYEKIVANPKFTHSYLLQNKRTGQMAEIKAASAYHACNIIGWKANKVQVIMEKEIVAEPETTSISK